MRAIYPHSVQQFEKLDQNLEQLQQATSVARIGFWRWVLASNSFEWSEQIYLTLDVDPQHFAVTLESTLALIHPDDREEAFRLMLASIKEGTEQSHIYRAVRPDGQIVWFWSNSRPVFDERGDVYEVRGTCQDITDRIVAEAALWESEHRFRAIADDSPMMIWVSDAEGKTVFYNRVWTDWTGQSQADALGDGWLKMIHPQDRPTVEANFVRASGQQKPFQIEYRLQRADGSWSWVFDAGQPRYAKDGGFLGYVGSAFDISERRAVESALRESEEFSTSILEASSNCIEVLDLDGRLIFTNGTGLQLMEINDFAAIANKPWRDLWPSQFSADVDDALVRARAGDRASFTSFCPTMTGKPLWWDVTVSPIMDETRKPVRLLAISRDVTEAKRSRDAIAYLAHHDSLTGLANRAKFQDQLAATLSDSPECDVALLLLDLDRFKEINDSSGHPVGDKLLTAVAERLRPLIADQNLLARVGGDEFAVICDNDESSIAATDLAERLTASLQVPFEIDGASLKVGVSIGIASSRGEPTPPDELLKHADIALYQAKSSGRGSYRYYDERMHLETKRRVALAQDLAVALQAGEFELHYQPLLHIQTSQIIGFEALLRWRHPVHGMIPPADFIGLAEETGIINALGEWVLNRACLEASNWPKGMIVAVNLSPRQFDTANLPSSVMAALKGSGLQPTQLQLEITESVLLHDSEQNLRMLHALRATGASVALDDFGTGFSSLSYLKNFPFDRIKIDRSFVREIGDPTSHSAAIIRAVLNLAKSLGLPVTAEGVETSEQLAWLRDEGCSHAQGYLISRPVTAENALRLMNGSGLARIT